MPVALKLGPHDHGRELDYDEFMSASYDPGFKYEIIDGRLYVSPLPNMPENRYEIWLCRKLTLYSIKHPEVINHVSNKGRVFVRERPKTTVPEPDIIAYRDFPEDAPADELAWEDVSPILIAEVLSGDAPDKDLERNPELFIEVPSVKEYWGIDIRGDPKKPTLVVFRRRGSKWHVIEVAYGETYTTKLLPGFKLIVDLHR